MNILIKQKELLDGLQKTLGPTTSKQNFPALNSILLEAQKDILKFTTTDLDITIIAKQQCEITEEGRVLIPMKQFISVIKELPNEPVLLKTTNNHLFIKCGKIEFKINGADPKEFPSIEESKKALLIKLNPQEISEMIRLTSFCVSHEETNYVLGGILWEISNNEVRLVASDGKRLSFSKKTLPPEQPEVKNKITFILPIKTTNELQKLIKERDEEIFLFTEENKAGFDLQDTQIVSRLIEGEFPNYNQYIPKQTENTLTISKRELLASLRRISILSTPDYQGVKVTLKKDQVTLSKNTPQLGEAQEDVEANYSGKKLEIGFNPNYLIDALRNIEDELIYIEFFEADKPAVIRKEGFVYLVLPMKI